VTKYIVGVCFAALGDVGSAIDLLEASYAEREGHMVMLKVDPRFDVLRDDPRFQDLIRKVGFPE
ncbi:MAG: hypothetical protein ABL959_24325, partial [Pyrinomonadaceae bacterium]